MGWLRRTPAEPEPHRAVVERIARRHLAPEHVAPWLALLRPAVRLARAGRRDPVVGRLGGEPRLPYGVEWPEWEGHGPLSFVAELDCAALAAYPLDITLPPTGRLLFFYFDGSYDGGVNVVGPWEPASQRGARVLHVPDGVDVTPRRAPEGITTYDEAPVTGREWATEPDAESPELRAAFADVSAVTSDEFLGDLGDDADPWHHVGGYAQSVQGLVELEVAQVARALRSDAAPTDEEEAARWTLLLQIDEDDELDMAWGDAGVLYWLARRDVPVVAEDVLFTWQCG